MLAYLHVKNLALIDEAEVEFGPGLNILTGETGAGKSILMGAVNLALGQKASKEMLRNPEEAALVELIFQIDNPYCLEKLQEQDIPVEDHQLIITRKITAGRSISRINGEACTIAQIREISPLLLDIHGQHEHQSLLYREQQLAILDAYGKDKLQNLKTEVQSLYQNWGRLKKELAGYQMDEDARKREISYLEFVVEEIENAAPKPGEDEELEEQYRRIANSKTILESMARVLGYVDDESGAGAQVTRALQEIVQVENLDRAIEQQVNILYDVESMLSDLKHEIQMYADSLSFSDEEFYEMDQRLTTLNNLKAKYGTTIDEILTYQKEKQKELDRLYHFEANKEKLEIDTKKAETQLERACDQLSAYRKKCARELSDAVRNGLLDLNFLDVQFSINFEKMNHYSALGYDNIEFLISTNPGEPLRPLAKVASGGELSRIMLAIKTLLADKDETETLIFDEIDTGISGRTAQKVSEKMAFIGRNHQVLCITHLPQIVAMADRHYEIVKNVEDGQTRTKIRKLNEEDSVRELARILGGAEITVHTLDSAGEMKILAQKLKTESVK